MALEPCGHNFCAPCLSNHLAAQLQAGRPVSCPFRWGEGGEGGVLADRQAGGGGLGAVIHACMSDDGHQITHTHNACVSGTRACMTEAGMPT